MMMIPASLRDYLSKNDNTRYTRCIYRYTNPTFLWYHDNSKLQNPKNKNNAPSTASWDCMTRVNPTNSLPRAAKRHNTLLGLEEGPLTKAIECCHRTRFHYINPELLTLLLPSSLIPSRRLAFSQRRRKESARFPSID